MRELVNSGLKQGVNQRFVQPIMSSGPHVVRRLAILIDIEHTLPSQTSVDFPA